MENIKKEITALILEINKHSENYYQNDNPTIADSEFDTLMNKLKALEKQYPELVTSNSPTQKIGGSVKFSPVAHTYKMESLQDVFSKEELSEFIIKTNNQIDNNEYVLEYKIDGLSINLEYNDGKLLKGATRGDGTTGEDVTENIYQIDCIPKLIEDKRHIFVRGEVYMKNSVFSKINETREKNEQKLLANPRNAAAGSLRQLDANLVKERKLSFLCFNVENALELGFTSHVKALEYMKNQGVPTSPSLNKFTSIEDISNEIDSIYENSKTLDFGIDGAVIKIDNLNSRQELGSTSKFPKWAAAFKYPAEIKESKLLDITITVGRTGALTPNAVLSPVFLAGTTVSKATLHNKDFIDNLDLHIGDYVNVRKAGEIIPEIISVNKEKRTKDATKFEMPSFCPSCNKAVVYDESEVALRCTNVHCPAQIEENIIHFASKNAMDIDGLGDQIVKALISANLIEDVADLYTISIENLLELERFAEKSATNLVNEIRKSKDNQLERLLFGLGLRHVGQKASKILAHKYSNIDNLASATFEDVTKVNEIGPKTAESVIAFFSNVENIKIINKLKDSKVNLSQESTQVSDKFKDLTFVVTGTLSLYTRKEITEHIESFAGKVSASVSKKTNYLVAGEDAGSKLKKALELGITILTEEEFKTLANK